MLNMVRKDFIVHRVSLLVYLAVIVVLHTPLFPIDGPLALVTMLAAFFSFGVVTQDDRYNVDVLLNSLPVNRTDIVSARYLFHLSMGLCFIAVSLAGQIIAGASPATALSQALVALATIAVFGAVFFPMYYWLGSRFLRLGMVVVTLLLVSIGPIVQYMTEKNYLPGVERIASLSPGPLYALLGLGVVVVLLGSWRTSVALYMRREF